MRPLKDLRLFTNKKLFSVIITLFILCVKTFVLAQSPKVFISVSSEQLPEILESKTLTIRLEGINSNADIAKIQTAAANYTNYYTISFINVDFITKKADCKFSFIGKINMPMVYRLFIATGLNDLYYNGTQVLDKEKFFFKENPIRE